MSFLQPRDALVARILPEGETETRDSVTPHIEPAASGAAERYDCYGTVEGTGCHAVGGMDERVHVLDVGPGTVVVVGRSQLPAAAVEDSVVRHDAKVELYDDMPRNVRGESDRRGNG